MRIELAGRTGQDLSNLTLSELEDLKEYLYQDISARDHLLR